MDYFNNFVGSVDLSFADQIIIYITHQLSVFLLNLISYAYILAKFYKVLCYSKMTFEWLPMINPYIWPFSVFHVVTDPYFAFWARILPNIKLDKSSVEISGIIALESLNSLIYVFIRLTTVLIEYLDRTEQDFLDKIN
jgi:uncharacterized protein YggT (Ycf19 family)